MPDFKSNFRKDDLFNHFKGLKIEEEDAKYAPKIEWLGVDSVELKNLLTYLFNNNVETFKIDDTIKSFNIDEDLLKYYLRHSMLFGRHKEGWARFRFLKMHILPGIMKELVGRFETAIVERGAMDMSHSDFASYPTGIIEYHRIGKIFDLKDSYAISILSYIKEQIKQYTYTTIAVIDNGWEKALFDLIPIIFDNVRVIRIVNYYGEHLISPFDSISKDEQVIVICDVVNTGKFIKHTLNILQQKTSIPITGVFSFLVNSDFRSKSLFDNKLIDPKGFFGYYHTCHPKLV